MRGRMIGVAKLGEMECSRGECAGRLDDTHYGDSLRCARDIPPPPQSAIAHSERHGNAYKVCGAVSIPVCCGVEIKGTRHRIRSDIDR